MDNKLGEYLRTRRGAMSLREFALMCGISHTHLDSIEKGIDPRTGKPVSLTLETLDKIAHGLDVETDLLTTLYFGQVPFAPKADKLPEIAAIERAAMNMSGEERRRMLNLVKAAFDYAFDEE